jgi:hypothetical protein
VGVVGIVADDQQAIAIEPHCRMWRETDLQPSRRQGLRRHEHFQAVSPVFEATLVALAS